MPLRAVYRSNGHKAVLVHEQKALRYILEIIQKHAPQLMIEFGTSWGGFTLLMHSYSPHIELHSYDLDWKMRRPDKKIFGESVYFYKRDILTEELEEIVNLCQDERKVFLYCDNGNKIKEIKMYGSKLKSGDMLGVHDWGKELIYDDVKDVLDDFKPHKMNEFFEKKGWMSRFFIKKS